MIKDLNNKYKNNIKDFAHVFSWLASVSNIHNTEGVFRIIQSHIKYIRSLYFKRDNQLYI